jgi:DNA polymerase III delta subunit
MDRVGMDLRRLSAEVAKISAFVGPDRKLGRDEIEAVVAQTAPVSIFSFTDAVGLRELETALRSASALRDEGESPVRLATMGTWHMRNIIKVKALAERGLDRGALTRAAGLRGEWQARNLMRQADRFTASELVAGLRGAAEMEAEMKTSPVEPGLVLERWIAAVCRATP